MIPELKAKIEKEAEEYVLKNTLYGKRDASIGSGARSYYETELRCFIAGASKYAGPQWISVKDQLPNNDKNVLCINSKGVQWVGFYTKQHETEYEDDDISRELDPVEIERGVCYLKSGWYECEETPHSMYDYTFMERHPTHWMTLPQRPIIDRQLK